MDESLQLHNEFTPCGDQTLGADSKSNTPSDQASASGPDAHSPARKDAGSAATSIMKLEDLQPDVLYHVLLFLSQRDVAHIKMCSSRLRCSTLRACQHWAPKVEHWLLSDPSRAALLRQLRDADPGSQHVGADQQHTRFLEPSPQHSSADLQQQQVQGTEVLPAVQQCCSTTAPLAQQQQQQLDSTLQGAVAHKGSATCRPPHQQQQQQHEQLSRRLHKLSSTGLDWRQVWSCLERAQQGPWQMDITQLTPAVAPNGVVFTMELLLQHPAPPAESGTCEQQAVGWRDNVTVLSFVLDGKSVEIVVDASGRVTSPQRDWCQGSIQLVPGQPRLLALEISYLFPVPAWFMHPCTLAAPRTSNNAAVGSSCGNGSCCSVSTVLDPNWDSHSNATNNSSANSAVSMSICQSTALCSAVPSATGDSNRSLSTTSLTSSGSLGMCNSSNCSRCGANAWGGGPRLSLDLSTGFGSFVMDPRYIDEASPNMAHKGLERLELANRVCWRPNKVQAWLGRLLPGICSHAVGAVSYSSSGNSALPGPTGNGNAVSVGSVGSGLKPVVKPSYAVTLSKAAAWQVPSDPDRRFAEGFMFWAVEHKLEQLLQGYGILNHSNSVAS